MDINDREMDLICMQQLLLSELITNILDCVEYGLMSPFSNAWACLTTLLR